MYTHDILEKIFVIGFCALAVSIFLYRIVIRFGLQAAKKLRGIQIIFSIILLLTHGVLVLGLRNTLIFVITSITIGTVFETIGVKTGWIFGKYHYTEKAGPKIANVIPISIPLMWCSVTYMGLWLAELIIFNSAASQFKINWLLLIITPLIVTMLDLITDPIAADEGIWIWEKEGPYCGIPMTNIVGWFITAFTIVIISANCFSAPIITEHIPRSITYLPALGFCLLAGISTRVCFERKLILPAIIGLIGTSVSFIVAILRITMII